MSLYSAVLSSKKIGENLSPNRFKVQSLSIFFFAVSFLNLTHNFWKENRSDCVQLCSILFAQYRIIVRVSSWID